MAVVRRCGTRSAGLATVSARAGKLCAPAPDDPAGQGTVPIAQCCLTTRMMRTLPLSENTPAIVEDRCVQVRRGTKIWI